MNRNKYNIRKITLQKITAFVVAAIMLLFSVSEVFAATNDNGGFDLKMTWTGSNDANYTWDTAAAETKTVRMLVSYSNKAPERKYEPGELIITVPGIGNANRGGTMQATDVAADKASSPVKTKNWSYTYNSKTDTYVFVNNVPVEEGSAFVGSFELLWTMYSRDTVDGFSKTVEATLQTSDNIRVTSGSIKYSQKRTPDEYKITQSPTALYSAEGINGDLNIEDYYWVGFPITGTRQTKSLAIKESRYKITVPEGAVVTYASDSISDTPLVVEKEGDAYIINQNAGVDEARYLSGDGWTYIYVAYPKDKYSADSVIQNKIELEATYKDHDGERKTIAQSESTLRMGDYGFKHHEGSLYTFSERAFGPRTSFDFHSKAQTNEENKECYEDGFLNATDLISGKGNARFGLGGSVYETSVENAHTTEHGIDFIDVLLNSGNYRQLDKDEYEYTTLEIPSTNKFCNDNGISVQSGAYGVDVYAVTLANPGVKVLVSSTAILGNSQKIALPAGTYSVSFQVKALKESVIYENYVSAVSPFMVTAKFHIKSQDGLALGEMVKTDQGRVISTSYFKIFDKNGAWINNDFDANDYDNSTNLDIAQRDMDTYGTYLERERDLLHVHEITSLYYANVDLENNGRDSLGVNLKASLRTRFKYSGDGDLKKFTMATVLPDGVRLPYSQIDVNDFLASLSISGISGLSSAEALSKVSATIDNNYKGSGKVYIRMDFDLTGLGITNPYEIRANFPAFISNEDLKRCGANYSMQSVSMIGDTDYVTRAQHNGSTDNGNYDTNPALWNDMNQNASSIDQLSYARDYLTIVVAEEAYMSVGKSVATEYTNGQYYSGSNNETPNVGYDGSYEYKLKLNTEKNSKAKNIVFVDNLEIGDNAEWQGKFAGVDVSYATKKGFTPTVYYSTDPNQSKDLKSAGWSTQTPIDPSTVKSIAVDLGPAMLGENDFVYVIVKMNAPSLDQNLKNKMTENNFFAGFTSLGLVTGNEEEKSLVSNLCKTKLIEPFGRAILIKTDNKGVALPNVKFDFFQKDGTMISNGLVTNSAGQIIVDNLPYGDYYFVEKESVAGYEFSSTPVNVTVNGRTVQVNAVNQRKPGQVSLVKKNSDNLQLYVKGAVFSLFKSDGTLVKKGMVTNQEGKLDKNMYPELGNLEWGSYYFQETAAPSGYALDTTPISFQIDAKSAESAEGKILDVKNSQEAGGNVQFTKYETLEDGVTETNNPVSNAVYDLYFKSSGSWKNIGTYITDNNGEIYISGLIFGDYYLKEKSAPQGYHINNEEIHFTVGSAHILNNFQTAVSHDIRKYGNINVHKTGDSKENVKGAVFGLFDLNGNKLREGTTTAEGDIDFKEIPWGDYYIQEISAPSGYELNTTKYPVTVNRESVDQLIVQSITNTQFKGKVRLTKMAEADHSIKLAGAEYSLYKNDGTFVGKYVSDDKGEIFVENLSWGSYYFEETKAPGGYGMSSDKIRFSVNATSSLSVQELEAFDPVLSAQVTITKKIKKDSIVFAHGVPYFTFKLEGTDINNISHTYYKTVSFTEDYVNSLTEDAEGYISASVVFAQLASGNYEASEENVIRYSQSKVIPVENATLGADDTVTFDLTNGKLSGVATFVNDKLVQGGTSHTSLVNNVIRKSKVITGISAEYKSSGTITTSTIDRSKLDVYAIYDDGSQSKLADDAYTLDPETFEGMEAGNYTVTASYNGGGAVKKATFQVSIDPPIPFTWSIDTATKEASITGYTGSSSVVRFPSTVKQDGVSYPVTSLLGNANKYGTNPIKGLTGAKNIIIPEGIKIIGHGAFYNLKNLTGELKLPTTLTEIRTSAFRYVPFIGELIIPENVTVIGDNAFSSCSGFRGDLVIPNGVTRIEPGAFSLSGFDGTLTLSENLQYIGNTAFQAVNFKGSLRIPDSVTEIAGYAFQKATFDGTLTLSANLKTLGNYSFESTGFTGNLVIPDGVERIENNTFSNCKGFNGTLTLSNNLKYIGNFAFAGTGFTSELVIPYGVTELGSSSFNNCLGFTGNLVIPDSVTSVGGNAFSTGSSNKPTLFTGLTLSKNLKTIGSGAFRFMGNATGSLVIPDSVETLGDWAFAYDGFTSIKFPVSPKFTKILDDTFYSMEKLISPIVIPEGITDIGASAFSYARSPSLVLPSTLKTIGNSAFQSCSSILGTLTLPAGLVSIGNFAFSGCTKISGDLILPDSLESIGTQAFLSCYDMNGTLMFPNNAKFTAIPDESFKSTGFKTIIMSDYITTVGNSAFYNGYLSNTNKTETIVLSKNLTSIGTFAFYQRNLVQGTVRVPSTIDPAAIGANAFSYFGKRGFCTVELPRACQGRESVYGDPWYATVAFYD